MRSNEQVKHAEIQATAKVVAVSDDVVTLESLTTLPSSPSSNIKPLMKNEVVYICPQPVDGKPQERLKAEVLRVRGRRADAQVYEDTTGVAVGDLVEQTGQLLSVELGPGLLRQVYDGLQNPLHRLEILNGKFLLRGAVSPALDRNEKWSFVAKARVGDRVVAGDVLGQVQEGRFSHKIMVPFQHRGVLHVDWIQEGSFPVDTIVARLRDEEGVVHKVSMVQQWPVRMPLPAHLIKSGTSHRQYPSEPMITTLRLIDTFFPIAKGGTACIPGPFGAGKTVLQNLISRYSNVDIVIVVACGERAGEVVETINEFPQLQDPHTGGTLMDRTIIICNTSSMPVAAREASIYTGVTIGEYYRQMGYNVLLLADSTSRWAQAMRETSGRLEEIPGEEAFPAYLESSIRNLYERAGVIQANDQSVGSLTLIGTVSPAGGNFEEPVTQGTLNTVKAFLGLSYDRAYKRFYPAVDPLMSWSRYVEQLAAWFADNMGDGWLDDVEQINQLLYKGEDITRMMQVTGEEGVSTEDFIIQQKAMLVDMVYLQQDAFDPVDVSTSIERQKESFRLLKRIADVEMRLASKADIRRWFNRMTDTFKNLNYAEFNSDAHKSYLTKVDHLIGELS
ncbi:V-type ATP synthase subunit A [Alkalimarinus coralli]|uniref:V-type ATP synthase subunit A n=1 Tax=Alkalimarinus coralli TaxID=2935863 RepID=UPI00202B4291|nr:V-type ATP synthase subunit A [Alkalimarinus coralli]